MRACYLCGKEISECMGSVHAGSFLDYIAGVSLKLFELCGKCSTKAVNSNPPHYPQPSNYQKGQIQ